MTGETAPEPENFRAALALWPSGVTITTTVDAEGRDWGFTASAFSSLSLSPPLVLVCLDASAECHEIFLGAQTFAINILRRHHEDLARRFATRGADKFAGDQFVRGAHGAKILRDAVALLECTVHSSVPAGDHTIVVGQVLAVQSDPAVEETGDAMLHFARGFRAIGESR